MILHNAEKYVQKIKRKEKTHMKNIKKLASIMIAVIMVFAMIAMVSTKLLDYMLLDEVALAQYRGSGMIGPVEKVLTPAQLAVFEGKLLPVTAEDGSEYLGVVDITDTAFARDCITGSGKVYIAFPGNTVRADRLDTFLDWLLAWEG
jgi:hypothetical protein